MSGKNKHTKKADLDSNMCPIITQTTVRVIINYKMGKIPPVRIFKNKISDQLSTPILNPKCKIVICLCCMRFGKYITKNLPR